MAAATLVFDFDGTLALGHGPVLAYARQVATLSGDDGFVPLADDELTRLDAGLSDSLDGYDAVRRLAESRGVDPSILAAAYQTSRAELGTPAAPVELPQGLGDFVAQAAQTVRLVVATNAPPAGIEAVLSELPAVPGGWETHYSLGKPAGLAPLISRLLADGPVLVAGDIWELDLAVPAQLGAMTALVGPHARRPQYPAMLRGDTLADLFDDITIWVAAAIQSDGASAPHNEPEGNLS